MRKNPRRMFVGLAGLESSDSCCLWQDFSEPSCPWAEPLGGLHARSVLYQLPNHASYDQRVPKVRRRALLGSPAMPLVLSHKIKKSKYYHPIISSCAYFLIRFLSFIPGKSHQGDPPGLPPTRRSKVKYTNA